MWRPDGSIESMRSSLAFIDEIIAFDEANQLGVSQSILNSRALLARAIEEKQQAIDELVSLFANTDKEVQ